MAQANRSPVPQHAAAKYLRLAEQNGSKTLGNTWYVHIVLYSLVPCHVPTRRLVGPVVPCIHRTLLPHLPLLYPGFSVLSPSVSFRVFYSFFPLAIFCSISLEYRSQRWYRHKY